MGSKTPFKKKVLVLDPEDEFALFPGDWDLIVDFGHAPDSTYRRWSRETGVPFICLHALARRTDDLHRVRELLALGQGRVVDEFGIDWWDTFGTMLWPDFLRRVLIPRLAKEVGSGCRLYMSRPLAEATILQALLGAQLISLESSSRSAIRGVLRPFRALSHLTTAQAAQVVQDKFDRQHAVRHCLSRRTRGSTTPVILLPSAYINVSRTAVAYSKLLPEDRFLLLYARRTARMRQLPSNVSTAPLDGYFVRTDASEIERLSKRWRELASDLAKAAPEFATPDAENILAGFADLLRWGVSVRDAWSRLLDTQNVAGCLSADDGNPYTLIPLLLAQRRGIPTVACHHGALDYTMALKTLHADHYLARNEMELDFLVRECNVAAEKIVLGGPPSTAQLPASPGRGTDRAWVVLFTEPCHRPWRPDEVYRDLVQAIAALCKTSGLKLLLKVHPFESVKSYRRSLRRWLPAEAAAEVEVIAGPASPELWRNARFAVTVESTIALECAERAVPVFLCGWLKESYTGYVDQYARFGVGHVLQSVDEITNIPNLLTKTVPCLKREGFLPLPLDPQVLQNLLKGTPLSRVASRP